jgi:hypothetical protein
LTVEFLEDNQICAWAEAQGLACGDAFEALLPVLPSVYRQVYANGRKSGHETAAAGDLVTRLGSWDECLVVITLWGVWASSEDWPKFYAWRGARNECRSLQVAPGHRFDEGERILLTELITLIMENAWDADILCSRSGRADRVRGKISHDEWYEIMEATEAAG